MDSRQLLELSQRVAAAGLTSPATERLSIIVDQIQVLQDDERRGGDTAETAGRRRRLQAGLEELALASRTELPGSGAPAAYRGGALLAFRYAEERVFRKAIAEGIEECISRAVSAVGNLQGIQPPDVAVCGGAADFWLFSERPDRVSKFDTLRAFFCLGLQVQRQLTAYGAVPAFLLDWEDDATYLSSLKSRTILSGRLRSAHDALLGSQPAHILLSDDCRRSLSVVSGAVQSPLLADLVATLDSPSADLSCSVEKLPAPISSKSGIPMAAVSYSVGPEIVAGSWSAYTEYAAIQHRENRSGVRPGESFIQLLADADECMIIGISNEHLAENYLIPALAERRARGKEFWGRLVVVFPSFKSTPLYVEERAADDRVHRRASGLRTVISLLKSEDPSGRSWKVAEYEGNLPFTGTWTSGGSGNSRVSISPILPGCNVDETFAVELCPPTRAYAEAVKSFKAIDSQSADVGEWNLLGVVSGQTFLWTGIVSRSAPPAPHSVTVFEAVVLILVHGITSRGRRVYLQLRSNLNGSTGLGLYSNISGKLTIHDAYEAAAVRQPPLISPEDADALTADALQQEVLGHGQEIPADVWRKAAVREVEEELGLKVGETRLIDHGNLTLVRLERDSSLFFRLFSLELTSTTQGRRTVAEISEIRRKRPGGGMDSDFSLNDIRRLGEQRRLNALLASNLDSFVEIYKNLGISSD